MPLAPPLHRRPTAERRRRIAVAGCLALSLVLLAAFTASFVLQRLAALESHLFVAGDVGGSNCRLQMVRVFRNRSEEVVLQKVYRSRLHASFAEALGNFLELAESRCGQRPSIAVIGMAGPVVDNSCNMSNLGWPVVVGRELARDLGLAQVLLLNDFVCNGYGLLGLKPGDIVVLNSGKPQPAAPKGLIGAGTGLGQAYLTSSSSSGGAVYRVWPCEGGHADFAPRTALEVELREYARRRLRLQHVSAERLVSGSGLVLIYDFLRQRAPFRRSPAEAEIRSSSDPGSAVTINGLSGRDQVCSDAIKLFLSLYGSEAGNLALKLLPYGGIYISGGIAARMLERIIEGGEFLQSFLDKGRMRHLLEEVPLYIVKADRLGMLGAQVKARSILQGHAI